MGLLFAFIGLIFGGFGGAVVGFLIGRLLNLLLSRPRVSKSHFQTEDFIKEELLLAAYVAKADNNRLLRSEMTYVQNYLRQRIGDQNLQGAMLVFREYLNRDIQNDVVKACLELRKYATINEKQVILYFLFGFATANGEFLPEEEQAIRYVASQMGLSSTVYEAIKAMFVGYSYQGSYGQSQQGNYSGGSQSSYRTHNLDDDYKILEISPDATDDEVKKAYRNAAKKHHPDRVSHLGEDVRKAAEEKFAKVNEAYDRIKKARGMN